MEYCKLQIGCFLIFLYIIFIYYKEKRKHHDQHFSIYDVLLVVAGISLVLDGFTAYSVNHLDMFHPVFNRIVHGLFLASIDTIIFTLFIYMLEATEGLPGERKKRMLFGLPYLLNIGVVFYFIKDLEYYRGQLSYYSMGISAYTCYIMAAIYMLLTIAIVFRRWHYIQRQKRMNIVSCLIAVIVVTSYQMIHPDVLISSLANLLIVLGTYMNQEDPAMKELIHYHEEMVMGFATLIENRDENTGGHVKRTTHYVQLLTKELRKRGYYQDILTVDYMKNLFMAAPMHDIGKIAISDAILQKPGKLTNEEFELMKQHTIKGGQIIQDTFGRIDNVQFLTMAYDIALYHHEKWNGKGYPYHLKRKEIPLCARIMAIADVFDAVSENRCYRQALPLDECFEIIANGAGLDFDPLLTEVFLDIKDQVIEIHQHDRHDQEYDNHMKTLENQ